MTKEGPFMKFEANEIKISASPTKVIEGFELQEGYPNCCPYHKSILKNITKWWSIFPNCCQEHKEMAASGWMKKEDYSYVPEKILTCVAYFEYHLSKKINDDNWFVDIKHYIEHLLFSFGHPSIGYDKFYHTILHYVEAYKPTDWVFPEDRRTELITYLTRKEIPEEKNTDLNLLYNVYQKWLKTVPDIYTFSFLKEKTTDKAPLNFFLHKVDYNPYTGFTSSTAITKGELIQTLYNLTKYVLNQIDTPQMLKENIITDAQLFKINLINEKHKLNQLKLVQDYNKSEAKYVKIIKNWLDNEKKYFEEIIPELNKLPNSNQKQINYIPIKEKHSDSNINNQDNIENSNPMSPKIFNDLLHGSLRPWLFDFSDITKLGKKLKSANELQLDSVQNVNSSLSSLLADFPEYNDLFQNQTQDINFTIPHFNVDVPESNDLSSSFIAKLIESETLRFYNEVLSNKYIIDASKDTQFQIGHKVLKSILGLIEELKENLNENNIIISLSLTYSNISVFTFVYLHNKLLALYFSIQHHYKDNLQIEFKDEAELYFYKFGVMECPVTLIEQSNTFVNKLRSITPKSIPTSTKLNFDFKGDDTRLKDIVKSLCLQFNFLQDTNSSQKEFIEVFTTKDLKNCNVKIQIACQTNMFTLIQDNLKKLAPNFKDATIEKSNLFYSQNGTKLTAQNLSKSRKKTTFSEEIKTKMEKIFS